MEGKRGLIVSFGKKINHSKNKITYFLKSLHLDQGFPGNLNVWCSYQLLKKNLIIKYDYISD